MTSDDLMFNGRPVSKLPGAPVLRDPTAPLKKRMVRIDDPEARRIDGDLAGDGKPTLFEELVAEYARLAKRDKYAESCDARLADLMFKAEQTRKLIKARQRFLRQEAAKVVRKRHGIKVIPGYNDTQFSYRAEIAVMPRHVQQLLKKLGIALPAEFQPESEKPQPIENQ